MAFNVDEEVKAIKLISIGDIPLKNTRS